jgi:hypothetical protein
MERQSVEELHDLRFFIKSSLRLVSIFHLCVAPGFASSVRVEWQLCGGDLVDLNVPCWPAVAGDDFTPGIDLDRSSGFPILVIIPR